MQKKLILLLGVFSLLLAAVYYVPRGYQQTIVMGMYEECPVDVTAEADAFSAAHPQASLLLKGNISQAAYGEWLAQGFLSGQEPDIFIIPPEDLEKYIQLGALQDLNLLLNGHEPVTKAGTKAGTEAALAAKKSQAPFYALTINTSEGDILMGISSRAKYPRLTFELLQAFNQ